MFLVLDGLLPPVFIHIKETLGVHVRASVINNAYGKELFLIWTLRLR